MSVVTPYPEPPSRRRLRLRRPDGKRLAIGIATFGVFLLLWYAYVTYVYEGNLQPFLPTPASTLRAFFEMLETGELQEAIRESGSVLLVGSIPGVILGIAAGLVIGAVRPLHTALSPYLFAFYATPFPALIPIFLIIFGYFLLGKGAIVFTLVFMSVILNTMAGVRSVDPRFLEAARSFGSPPWRTLLEVQLPAAMSFIVAGIRLAVGRALVGVVIAEFDSALSGLGALIFRHAGRLRLSEAFVPAVLLALVGIVCSMGLRSAERRLERWREVGV